MDPCYIQACLKCWNNFSREFSRSKTKQTNKQKKKNHLDIHLQTVFRGTAQQHFDLFD